jgi:CHAT domain-containing protein
LWEVNDRLAARFSREFYNRLLGLEGHHPLPLGEALHQARMVIRQLDPANPTWLAYVLYGDPYGQAVLGMPQA